MESGGREGGRVAAGWLARLRSKKQGRSRANHVYTCSGLRRYTPLRSSFP